MLDVGFWMLVKTIYTYQHLTSEQSPITNIENQKHIIRSAEPINQHPTSDRQSRSCGPAIPRRQDASLVPDTYSRWPAALDSSSRRAPGHGWRAPADRETSHSSAPAWRCAGPRQAYSRHNNAARRRHNKWDRCAWWDAKSQSSRLDRWPRRPPLLPASSRRSSAFARSSARRLRGPEPLRSPGPPSSAIQKSSTDWKPV